MKRKQPLPIIRSGEWLDGTPHSEILEHYELGDSRWPNKTPHDTKEPDWPSATLDPGLRGNNQ